MSILYFIIPMAVLLALGFIAAFIWATHQGQFDDLETPALKMLIEQNNNQSKIKKDGANGS